MGSPVIFNGKYAKLLTQLGIKFASDALLTLSNSDPTYTPPAGSIHIKEGTTPKVMQYDGTAWRTLQDATQVSSAVSSGITSAISGTTNYLPKFTGSNVIGNSSISEVTGTVTIAANLVVSGTTTTVNSTNTEVLDNILTLNKGETGYGVTAGSAGIKIDRGSNTAYYFVFDETRDAFVCGIDTDENPSNLQVLATREDSPNNLFFAFWDNTAKQFKTTGAGISVTLNDSINIAYALKMTDLDAKSLTYLDANKKMQSVTLTNGQILIGSTNNNPLAATLTGTTNQISIANGQGSITLSLPQNIHTGATPTFDSLTASKKVEIGTDDAFSWLKLVPRSSANRTGSPSAGIVNYNSTSNIIEYHNGTSWVGLSEYVLNLTTYPLSNNIANTIGVFNDIEAYIDGYVQIGLNGMADILTARFKVEVIKKVTSSVVSYEIASSTISGDTYGGNPLVTFSINSTNGTLSATTQNFTGFAAGTIVYRPYNQGPTVSVNGSTVNDLKTVSVKTTTSTISAAATPYQYLANSATPITFNLNTAVGNDGTRLWIKNIGAGALTIDPNGSETIDDLSTVVLDQYDAVTLFAYNGNWYII